MKLFLLFITITFFTLMDYKETSSQNKIEDQILRISVNGLVCDFCARGIEKTFKKDVGYLNIDVDLSLGKVLIAYDMSVLIDKSDVEKKILSNGQNLVDMQILSIP